MNIRDDRRIATNQKTSKVSYKHLRKERNNQMAHISFI